MDQETSTSPSEGAQSIPLACKDIVSKAFSPNVSISVSSDVNDVARDMGLDSFVNLLRPFGDRISGRITVCDSQAASVSFDDFAIRFSVGTGSDVTGSNGTNVADVTQETESTGTTSPTGASTSVATGSGITTPAHQLPQLFNNDELESYLANRLQSFADKGVKLTPQLSQELYLDFFKRILTPLSSIPPFETFNHPVTGVIAVSSRNEQPIETLSLLYNRSHDPQLVHDYINKDYLRYYVLVHDETTGDLDKSIALFEKMKRNFGLHCHMIRINRDTTSVDEASIMKLDQPEWQSLQQLQSANTGQESQLDTSHYIHKEDYESLQQFVREMVVQSVLPFMERCIATWNDQVASSRRGITGRFFSASKKYFSSSTRATSSILSTASGSSPFYFSLGGSGASTPASRSPTPPTRTISSPNYPASSSKFSYNYLTPEAQIRKLADFAFMLRDYKFAYTTYDLLKRDYHNDKAWSYLAGCEEMAAISYLMTAESLPPKQRVDIIDSLLDSSTYSYISRCSLPSYALRSILISSELLCTLNTPSAASDGATKWVLKALNERLVGRLGYAMLMERISGAYSAYDSVADRFVNPPGLAKGTPINASSVSLIQGAPDRSSTPASITSTNSNTSKIIASSTVRTSRTRKAAFWQLLAAREWNDANVKEKSIYCIDQANSLIYNELDWAHRPTGLLHRLQES
ncbi:Trs85p [Sugiyamaella lignohabitans]|uniref:Trs85p n=1 Tax=Sugiyamaella lignohabitans TaxID=796027 RepID=A0A161HJX5_9ASCO|nr:Trs85p [Sugiyamaella lignohabitans]ANB11818.1 Trs85p [Sugiyamaella lignohabitans]